MLLRTQSPEIGLPDVESSDKGTNSDTRSTLTKAVVMFLYYFGVICETSDIASW